MERLIKIIFIKIKMVLRMIKNYSLFLLIKQQEKKKLLMAIILDHKVEEIIMTIKIFKNIISGVNRLHKGMGRVENSKIEEMITMKMIFNMSVIGTQAFTKVTNNLKEIMDQRVNIVIKMNHTINKKEIFKTIKQVFKEGIICIKQNLFQKIRNFLTDMNFSILEPTLVDQVMEYLDSGLDH